MLKPSFFYVYFILFFCFGTGVANLFAANLEIGIGQTVSIGSSETLGNSELYGNKGTLKITGTGSLTIAAGVVNIEPPNDGIEGLELGIVQVDDLGEILAGQTIRFQENSIINGFVSSTSKIIFDGVSTFSGNSNAKIQTDLLLFNPSENKDENGKFLPTTLDLSGGAELDIDELVANGSVNIIMKDGEELELKALTVDGSGTIFNVSEDFTVLGNYTGGAGAMLISQLDENNTSLAHGVITLLGGGELSDGTNNLIMQSGILAKELRVQNLTAIAQNLTVYGDFTVLTPENGKESITTADYAVQIVGKTTLQPDTVLHLKGESYTNMTYFGYYYYNGLFFGGLELQNGSVLQTTGTDAVLSIALGDTSEFQNGSQIIAENIHLAGVDTSGSSELQLVRNGGKLSASGLLQLTTVNFENTGNGLLEINCLKLASSAILNLTSSGSENGGLTFTGDNPYLEISANSALVAEGKTLDLTGVEIINKNPANGIEAKSLVFGSGSSLAGAGNYAADATFKENSKIKLDSSGTLDFGDHAVWLKEGAVIELTVDSQGTGSILTEGKITMDNGVLLAIADGSTYSGRTKTFRIIQGSADSVFADLAMADSLFFKLNKTILDNENGLSVEITKSADLVDYVNSANQRNLGILIDDLLNQGRFDNSQKVVFDALLQIGNDSDYQSSLDSLSGATRENMLIFALSSPWRVPMENIGFHRLPLALEDNGTGLNQTGTNSGTSEDNARTVRGQKFFKKPSWNLPKQFSPKQYLSKRDSLQRFLPKRRISHDLWADVYYNYTKLNADGNAPGGNGSRGGFYIGMGLPAPLKESIFGVSFGYSAGQYKQSLDKADLGDFQIGFYGGMNLFSRNLQLRGYIGYGVQNYEIDRNVEVGSYLPTPVSGKTDGNSISAAFYFVRPVDISESFLVKPILGFDLERLTQDGFTEDGFEGLTLTYDKTSLMRTMFRLGITGDYVFRRVELTGRFMYGLKITGENTANSNHHFQNPANIPFRVDSINLGSNLFDLGFGGNISLNQIKTTLLFLDYNTTLGENSNAHTASLGFLWKR